MQIEIDGLPVSWKAHAGYGRKAFNPRFKEKEFYQWQIKSQWNRAEPYGGPVHLHVVYHMPVPSSTSKPRRLQMLNGLLHPISRPDLDNLNKFLCDCLKSIVMDDDSQIVRLDSSKIYGDRGKTIVKIEF